MAAPSSIFEYAPSTGPLRQGEIVSNLVQIAIVLESIGSNEIAVNNVVHPFAIVVSQDCDLEWDWDWRKSKGEREGIAAKLMSSVLFCEVETAEDARNSPGINSNAWNLIRTNRDIRYQFLQRVEPDCDLHSKGLPEMVVDFKRYFSIPVDEVYARFEMGELQRRCCFRAPYLQHLATRFYYYQYRVALPSPHYSE